MFLPSLTVLMKTCVWAAQALSGDTPSRGEYEASPMKRFPISTRFNRARISGVPFLVVKRQDLAVGALCSTHLQRLSCWMNQVQVYHL